MREINEILYTISYFLCILQSIKLQIPPLLYVLEQLEQMSSIGISNYSTTYQHDYTGKHGENRDYVFYYRSSGASTPDFAVKPPIGRPLTTGCGRPSGY